MGQCSRLFFHQSQNDTKIGFVNLPVFYQSVKNFLAFFRLGNHHKSARVKIDTVHHISRLFPLFLQIRIHPVN